jgi:hypothetical protein
MAMLNLELFNSYFDMTRGYRLTAGMFQPAPGLPEGNFGMSWYVPTFWRWLANINLEGF